MRDGSVNVSEAGVNHSGSNINPDLHSTAVRENPEGLQNKEPTLGNIVEEEIAVPDHEDPGDGNYGNLVQRTPGQVLEQSEVGFQPPSPPKNLEESVNYEEFARGLQIAETRSDEGFNETLEVDHIRTIFGGHKKGKFQALVSGETDRMNVA